MRKGLPPLLLILSLILGLSLGSVRVSFGDVLRGILPGGSGPNWSIVHEVRFPRVLMATITGAILSSVGAAFQNVLKNPLVDPYLLGVSAGASFGAVLTLHLIERFGSAWMDLLHPMSFAFAMISTFTVIVIAKRGGALPTTDLILSGVAVSSAFNAGIVLLGFLMRKSVVGLSTWIFGNLSGTTWHDLLIPSLSLALVLSVLTPLSLRIDAMGMGEDFARVSGVEVEKLKLAVISVGVFAVSTVVSEVGAIGFVGLVIPHAVRMIVGPKSSKLIPASSVIGAAFLTFTDTLSRVIVPPLEVPVGVITSFVGVPFFLYLLKRGRSGW